MGRWLEEHHDRDAGVWLVTWRRHKGRSDLGYEEVFTEALRFGWIDSKPSALDDERTAANQERIARLEARAGWRPPGRRWSWRPRRTGAGAASSGNQGRPQEPGAAAEGSSGPG